MIPTRAGTNKGNAMRLRSRHCVYALLVSTGFIAGCGPTQKDTLLIEHYMSPNKVELILGKPHHMTFTTIGFTNAMEWWYEIGGKKYYVTFTQGGELPGVPGADYLTIGDGEFENDDSGWNKKSTVEAFWSR